MTGDHIKFKVVFPFSLSKTERAWYIQQIRIFAARLKKQLAHSKKMQVPPGKLNGYYFEPEEI